MFDSGDLRKAGKAVIEGTRASGHFIEVSERNRQVLALAEECGEFVGAYRRWTGQARRSGTREEMEYELADVIITAYAAAYAFDIDIDSVIERKLTHIFQRGWKDREDQG